MALVDNCIFYSKFDNNTTDETGTYTPVSSGVTYTASGKINGCYSYDGVNDYINPTVVLNPATTEFSISAWVKRGGTGDYDSIYAFDYTGAQNIIIWFTDLSKLGFQVRSGSGTGTYTETTATYTSTSVWYHVVCTFGRTTKKLIIYVDGSEAKNTNYTNLPTGNITNPPWIGNRNDGSHPYNGLVDEFGIWTRVLSAAEAASLYNSGSGLVYPFSTGYANKIYGVTPSKVYGVTPAKIYGV